jgi:glycosyltransferase involved in cell wall biosynthesis
MTTKDIIVFSVIIPLYNKEKSIFNTISSVLNQDYRHFELIVVNDGSTDNSLKIVEQIKDDRLRILTKKNGGESSARNYGINTSKYKWLAFIDADDLWKKNHLSEVVKLISLFQDAKVFATSFSISGQSNIEQDSTKRYLIKNYFREVLNASIIWSSTAVVYKDCFSEVGLFNEKYTRGEDLDMWERLAKKYQIAKSSMVTAIYRKDAENRICNQKWIFEKSYLYDIALLQDKGYEKIYHAKAVFSLIIKLTLTGNFSTIFKVIKRVFRNRL